MTVREYRFTNISRQDFPFPLSHIEHYTDVQERSLHFGRDDGTGAALLQYVRCTLRGIKPSPVPSFRAQSRNPPCTLFFLAPFASGFPFSAISHTALYPIPSFRAQREIFLALRHFLLPSQVVSRFPLSHIGRYTGMQERSRATLGMTVRE